MTTSKTETMMHNKVCIHMTRMHHCFVSTVLIGNRVEALVTRHPRDSNKVFVTGAGCLGECKNTEFVWGLRKTCFFEIELSAYECLLRELSLQRKFFT